MRLPLVCLVALLFLTAVPAQAQPATLRGFVTDASDGQPLGLVNVLLRADDGTVQGAATDQDGLYVLTGLAPGRYAVRASFVGYEAFADTLTLATDEVRTLNIALAPDEAELDEVVVQAERTGGAAHVTAGQQTVRPADVELIPTPDVSADLAAYLTAMPGVVTSGDRGGQLFIRGGEPSQNLVLLDGMAIYQPFHLLGFYSAFPADVLSRADVYGGGYGARYGERVSSVIDVRTRNGNTRRYAGAAALSPFMATVRLEGPLRTERASFLASVRRSMVEQLAEPLVRGTLPFSFGDAFAKLYAEVNRNSRLSVSLLRTYDRGYLDPEVIGSPREAMRWQNHAAGARYLLLPAAFPAVADFRLSYARLRSELGPEAEPTRATDVRDVSANVDATFYSEQATVDVGMAMRYLTLANRLGGFYQNIQAEDAALSPFAFYVEPEFRVYGLRVRPGLRLQVFQVRTTPFFEPRLRLVWERGVHQVSAAAGRYRQEITGLTDRRDAAGVFTAWTNVPRARNTTLGGGPGDDVREGRALRAEHAILGYRATPAPWLNVSVEGFYKRLSNLFVAEWTSYPRLTTRLQPATGRSFGFDARVEARSAALYALVSYGYSATRYAAEQASIELWYGTERLHYRPPHDRRHQVNLLCGATFFGFDLSARWAFGSGLPFSRALAFDGFVLIDDIRNYARVPGNRRVVYERPYRGLLPAYHRLDVSLERTLRLRAATATVQASLVNTYDRRNLFYLDVFTLRRVDQLPLLPSLGIKVAFE